MGDECWEKWSTQTVLPLIKQVEEARMDAGRNQKIAFLLGVFVIVTGLEADRFKGHWYDGNAELATYRIEEMRYGELRNGVRVMVFVTEPMRLATHIKPDEKLPDDEQIAVIKLNDLLKFPTGVYDYSIMTSTFSSVEKKNDIPLMSAMKVAFSGQEWCGQVYERYIRKSKTFSGELFSYFESEGEKEFAIPLDNNPEPEENLWILIRELKEPFLQPGHNRRLRLIPSTWHRRKTHTSPRVVEAMVTKSKPTKVPTALGTLKAHEFTWSYEDGTTSVLVEKAWPHRILSWKERDGGSGTVLRVRREPYWRIHDNDDLHVRDSLALKRVYHTYSGPAKVEYASPDSPESPTPREAETPLGDYEKKDK